jgi:hypothetical protein
MNPYTICATPADQFDKIASQVEQERDAVVDPIPLPDTPWQFATDCCFTLDEASAWQTDLVVRPFPSYPYLQDVIKFMYETRYGRIDKSGQVLVSWAVIAYRLWLGLKKRGFRYAYYCGTQTKAEGHMRSRFYRMYLSIPAKYKVPKAALVGGQLLIYHDGMDNHKLPTAFLIPQAAEQGKESDAAEKMRSETWTAADLDESPFYPNLKELHNSLLPRTQDLHHIGTPNGREFFHLLGFGNLHDLKERTLEFDQLPNVKKVRQGVWRWERNGFSHLRVHYSAHPDRDPATPKGLAWRDQAYPRFDPRIWQREEEISYDVAAGKPVYDTEAREGFVGLIVKPQTYTRGLPLWRGWDFGYNWPFCLWAQLKLKLDASGAIIGDKLCFLRESTHEATDTETFGEEVKSETYEYFPMATVKDACDFYGGNQHRSSGPKTDVEILASIGIAAVCSPAPIKLGVDIGRKLLQQGDIEIDPSCTYLITALRTGYTRNDQGEIPSTPTDKAKLHPHSDVCDAFRYIVQQVYHFQAETDGKTVHRPPVGVQPPQRPRDHATIEREQVRLAMDGPGVPAEVHKQTVFRPKVGFNRR